MNFLIFKLVENINNFEIYSFTTANRIINFENLWQ